MVVKNGLVFVENLGFQKKNVEIKDGLFTKIVDEDISGDEVIDASGCYVIPGLVDVHLHAAVGHDFCDEDDKGLSEILKYELKSGITSLCPTSMTFPEDKLSRVFETIAGHEGSGDEADIVGINMEGPFIAEKKKGAQKADYIRNPDVDMFLRLQDKAKGLIKLCDIAPENPGGMEFIKALKDKVVISIAHTDADYETAMEAFQNGAWHVTHLYNAMNGFTHRAPGVVGAVSDCDGVYAELICDGVHINPASVRATFKMLGDDRIVLISDSMMAAGLDDGQYELGGQEVFVHGNKATLADGTIAGSVTNLMNCMKTLVKEMDIPLESAVKCATIIPARSIGVEDKVGSIEAGKKGDLVILDKDLEIVRVIKS